MKFEKRDIPFILAATIFTLLVFFYPFDHNKPAPPPKIDLTTLPTISSTSTTSHIP